MKASKSANAMRAMSVMVGAALSNNTINLRTSPSRPKPQRTFARFDGSVAGCKGDKSMTVPQQKRAAIKRNNIRKHGR